MFGPAPVPEDHRETPSPALSPGLRQRICETAVGIARAADHRNAGTVEFIFGGANSTSWR